MDSQYSRRAFVAGSAAGIAGILAASKLGFAAPSSEPSPESQSTEMLPPLSADVIVVGAGTSGAPAAIAAARQGARVILLEEDNVVGGAPVTQYVCSPCGAPRLGLYAEMLRRLDEKHDISGLPADNRDRQVRSWFLPGSYHQVLMEMMAEQKSLQLFCGARVVRTLVKEGSRNRVTGVVVQHAHGQAQEMTAPVIIDATGTGMVALLAGCKTLYGRDAKNDFNEPFGPEKADNKVQRVTWMFISQRFRPGPAMDVTKIQHAPRESAFGWLNRKATDDKGPDAFMKRNASVYLHWGSAVECDDTRDPVALGEAHKKAYANILPDINFLWSNGYAVYLAPKIGLRECRRVVCDHMVTVNDLKSGKLPEDAIALGSYGLDAWGEKLSKEELHVPPYGLPYGSIVAKETEGLLVVGKAMGGSHYASSSYRVQPILGSVGEAAGIAAAMAATNKTDLRSIDMKDYHQKLDAAGLLDRKKSIL